VSRIVVDPLTRIEGHLRIEARAEDGAVAEAWASATMWRGIEQVLAGRDPRDAWLFAQRICGVCTTVHALASVRAVEDALDIAIPRNAHLLRDLIATSQFVHDHVIHFYHLHALDWVDVTHALRADPARAAGIGSQLSDYPRNTAGQLTAVQQRLQRFVDSGRLGPFANGYWGHPAYALEPEVDLLAVSHYLDAIDFQREYVKIHALLGGKNPHPQTYLVGGMASPVDPSSAAAINAGTLAQLRRLAQLGLDFVRQAYLPDLLAIAAAYPEWAGIGAGPGNFLAFGDLTADPRRPGEPVTDGFLPGGVVRASAPGRVEEVDLGLIREHIDRSWFTGPDGSAARHPYDVDVTPAYTGPRPPYEELDVDAAYSWLRAPRYDGLAMEVGPLARVVIGYARGHEVLAPLVDDSLARLGVEASALDSTLGRTLARGLETRALAEYVLTLVDRLEANLGGGDLQVHDGTRWERRTWPATARGVGLHEAPRGALSHWAVIADGRLERYRAVVPTTWNASPRDADGTPGPYETALVGTPLADPERPLEILRTIHSFDPCMACAAHVVDADGRRLAQVRVS
jgi:Ni,Fe-hydrogenase I large subunit